MGDIVALPQLKCTVALEAQRAWHSYIKNGFLLHTDRVLAEWLRDRAEMGEFERCVRSVCEGIRGLSGSGLIPLLRPLSSLAPAGRTGLAAFLDRRFEAECRPDDMARNLAGKLDVLMEHVRRFSARPSGDGYSADQLGEIRAAACALWRELEKVPQGFWLPEPPAAEEAASL